MRPSEETFRGPGGSLYFRTWRPLHGPRGVVVICHGVNSHSGQYLWVADQLVAAGLAVYAMDLPGRGHSEGPRFYAEDIGDYVGPLATFIRMAKGREPGLKVFLLGHSAGGVTATSYALDHQAEIDGLICESFAFEVPAPEFALQVIKGVSKLAPHAPVLTLHNKDFSRDPAVVAAMNADPLIAGEVQPAATVAALVRADERMKKEFATITLPVFILHGTADKATRYQGSQLFFDTAGSSDKTLKLYEGHYHDLLNDIGKEDVMADIEAWIVARL